MPRAFQSTHPHRVRLTLRSSVTRERMFQSTHPHRVRHFLLKVIDPAKRFNPRTHIGCDLHGSTMAVCDARFQSTHPHRVRLTYSKLQLVTYRFQSTHPHRVRLAIPTRCAVSFRFQSTHPHRVRLASSETHWLPVLVSIHAPT